MEPTLSDIIAKALAKAREGQNSRENALVITKLEEALLWHHQDLKVLADRARQSMGVTGASPT